MKISKKKKLTKRKMIVLAVVAALAVSGVTAFAFLQNSGAPSNESMTKNIDETSSVKEDQTQNNEDEPKPNLPQKPSSQETPPPNNQDGPSTINPPETPNITRAEQSGSNIKVTAIFQKASSGNCELQLSKSGQQSITKSTAIVTGPSYYACGFTVPRATLPSGGAWNVTVVHHKGGALTNSATQTIQVQ